MTRKMNREEYERYTADLHVEVLEEDEDGNFDAVLYGIGWRQQVCHLEGEYELANPRILIEHEYFAYPENPFYGQGYAEVIEDGYGYDGETPTSVYEAALREWRATQPQRARAR